MELAKLISEKYGNPTNSVCDISDKEKMYSSILNGNANIYIWNGFFQIQQLFH